MYTSEFCRECFFSVPLGVTFFGVDSADLSFGISLARFGWNLRNDAHAIAS